MFSSLSRVFHDHDCLGIGRKTNRQKAMNADKYELNRQNNEAKTTQNFTRMTSFISNWFGNVQSKEKFEPQKI